MKVNNTPSVTQIGRVGASNSAAGLSLIVQLADGSYVIIDGGPESYVDEKALLDFLISNNPNEGKPEITWMFTHAHGDHMSLALNFLSRYDAEIELSRVCYNFPDFENITVLKEADGVKKAEANVRKLELILEKQYPDTETYIYHTGEQLLLPGCEIEFLITHEDSGSNEFMWINHTSSAWRMTIEGKTMLVLGDCEKELCQWMADTYGPALKCDILQLTHHGLNGACMDIYRYADPDICFWPIDQERFESDERCLGTKSGYEFNAWLRDDAIKERAHYAASDTITLTFPDLEIRSTLE